MRIIRAITAVLLCAATFFYMPQTASAVEVSAVSAIVIEAETGTVLFAKNAHAERAMASTTKIMTALLTIEAGDLDTEFTVDDTAILVEGTSMGLKQGDRVSRRDLLYGILLPSGNDAANAAAVSVSGSIPAFVEKMNEKAAELGLVHTHFVTPSGLDANGHYTTAYDLAMLTAYAMKSDIFAEVVACQSKTVSFGNPPYDRTLYNSNKMLRLYEGAIGVKTGFTDNARRCLVSAARREGVTLVAVTLNAGDDWNDHAKMLDYGFSLEQSYPLDVSCGSRAAVAGTGRTVGVSAAAQSIALLPEQCGELSRRVFLPAMLYGSVYEGEEIGRIEFILSGKTVRTVPLCAAETVEVQNGELSPFQKILAFFGVYV